MVDFVRDRWVTLRLSKSGKSLLFHDEFGNTYMSSVGFVSNLLGGGIRSRLLRFHLIGEGSVSVDRFNKAGSSSSGPPGTSRKEYKPHDDVLGPESSKSRESDCVKVGVDDW